jgi:hypothetical protein
MAGLGVARRLGFGLSRELWPVFQLGRPVTGEPRGRDQPFELV